MKTELFPVQISALGDSALVIQFGDNISPEIHARVKAFANLLNHYSFPGFIELVPAFTTVTVYYDAWVVSQKGKINPYDQVLSYVQEQLEKIKPTTETSARQVEIPVCYGNIFGPDLEFVAAHNKLSLEDVVFIHASSSYLVYMLGFAPGFPYLGGMSEKIATPRKKTPQSAIPVGSVGIAGNQTGVYSLETPGGWQLIGRTPLTLFNPHQQPATLLQPGDIIRFVPISPAEYEAIKTRPDEY